MLNSIEATDANWLLRLCHALCLNGRLVKTMPRDPAARCEVFDAVNELILTVVEQCQRLHDGSPGYSPEVFARVLERIAADRKIVPFLQDAIAQVRVS